MAVGEYFIISFLKQETKQEKQNSSLQWKLSENDFVTTVTAAWIRDLSQAHAC